MTALDYQVAASGDDGSVQALNNLYNNDATGLIYGGSGGWYRHIFARWANVIIPDGATITAAYVSMYYISKNGGSPTGIIYFEDAADPSAISSYADFGSRTKTTAYVTVGAGSGTWWNSNSLVSIIQELVDSYSYADGSAMQMILIGSNNIYHCSQRSYDYSGNTYGPKLHIEYTEAAAGGSLVIPSHRRRFQALLVR